MEELLSDPPLLGERLDYGLYLLHRDGILMHEFEGAWNIDVK
jgi:hypothetical protein